MENKKIFALGLLLVVSLFLINFSSACSNSRHYHTYDDSYENDYNYMDTNDGVILVLYDDNYYGDSIYFKENEDRYPAYDYRFGYTTRIEEDYYYEALNFRNSRDYKYDRNYYEDNFMNRLFDGKESRVRYQERPSYYYTYSDYMEEYQEHECYVNPPKDKILYVKCP